MCCWTISNLKTSGSKSRMVQMQKSIQTMWGRQKSIHGAGNTHEAALKSCNDLPEHLTEARMLRIFSWEVWPGKGSMMCEFWQDSNLMTNLVGSTSRCMHGRKKEQSIDTPHELHHTSDEHEHCCIRITQNYLRTKSTGPIIGVTVLFLLILWSFLYVIRTSRSPDV